MKMNGHHSWAAVVKNGSRQQAIPCQYEQQAVKTMTVIASPTLFV
jgi:hypothetical protein